MQLLAFLPWVLIIVGAFFTVRFAGSLGRKLSKPVLVALWVLAIGIPAVLQGVAAARFAPPFNHTKLVWALIDGLEMRSGDALFIADVIWRTTGALVGILVVLALTNIYGTWGKSRI